MDEKIADSCRREELVYLLRAEEKHVFQNLFIMHTEGCVIKTGITNYDYSTLTWQEIDLSLDQESIGKNILHM